MKVYFRARTTNREGDRYLIIIKIAYINKHNITILMFRHPITGALHQRPDKKKVQKLNYCQRHESINLRFPLPSNKYKKPVSQVIIKLNTKMNKFV